MNHPSQITPHTTAMKTLLAGAAVACVLALFSGTASAQYYSFSYSNRPATPLYYGSGYYGHPYINYGGYYGSYPRRSSYSYYNRGSYSYNRYDRRDRYDRHDRYDRYDRRDRYDRNDRYDGRRYR